MFLAEAKQHFHNVLQAFENHSISASEREKFLEWTIAECKKRRGTFTFSTPLNTEIKSNANSQLKRIATKLRQIVPIEDYLGISSICNWPKKKLGLYASDCTSTNTNHVDAYLLDDEDVDDLVDDGLLIRHFCRECSSTNIDEVNLISHSLSLLEINYLFMDLLPRNGIDLTGKTFIDIGSRLGAVLYSVSLFCPAVNRIVGIELNPQFCAIQQEILREFAPFFMKTIEIVNEDVRNCMQLFHCAGNQTVVFMNNVFGFFLDEQAQRDCWHYLQKFLLPGTILIHNPRIETVIVGLNLNFSVQNWLETIYAPNNETKQLDQDSIEMKSESESENDEKNESNENNFTICLYRVK